MNKIVIGIMLVCSASASHAQKNDKTGWIVGAGTGTTIMSIAPKNRYALSSNDEMATIATVYGGFNFTDWFGIEFDLTQSSAITDVNTNLDADIFGTSFSPKFTYHLNDNFSAYMKAGVQYIAYEQTVDYYYDDDEEITWKGQAGLFGAGLQYNFTSGVNARIDYKYSKLTLDKSLVYLYGYGEYEEIDFTYNALTVSAHYQF